LFEQRLSTIWNENVFILVVPVSAAMMTPLPLAILFIIKLIYRYRQKTEVTLNPVPSLEKLQQTTDISTIMQLNESTLTDRAE